MKSTIKEIADLYEHYLMLHNLKQEQLPFNVFEKLVIMFPSLLVANADGHIDTSERIFLDNVVDKCFEELTENHKKILKKRIRILMLELDLWKNPFMKVLESQIQKNPELPEIIADTVIQIARESSDDITLNILVEKNKKEFISPEEKEIIIEILSELSLLDDDRVIRKLKHIL